MLVFSFGVSIHTKDLKDMVKPGPACPWFCLQSFWGHFGVNENNQVMLLPARDKRQNSTPPFVRKGG